MCEDASAAKIYAKRFPTDTAVQVYGPEDPPPADTPGGSDKQVQFNNAGAFGGDADFTFDITSPTSQLAMTGSTTFTASTGTVTTIIAKASTPQSANMIGIYNSSNQLMSGFDQNGSGFYSNPNSWVSYLDGRVLTTSVAGRGSFNVTPTISWTANPTGIQIKSAAQFGINDSRIVNSSISTQDNIAAMEFNPGRGAAYTDPGVTSAVGATRNFSAIKSFVFDSAGQGGAGATGYVPIVQATPRAFTANTTGIDMSMSGAYNVNTSATFTYNSILFKGAMSMTPTATAGTITQNARGADITLTGTTEGTSTGQVFYGRVSGYDTNWFIFQNTSTADSFIGGDNADIWFGTGLDASLGYDGTNLVLDPDVVGSGVLQINGGTTVTGLATLATVDVNGGTIDGTTIGASSASTATFTTVTATSGTFTDVTTSTATVTTVTGSTNIAGDVAFVGAARTITTGPNGTTSWDLTIKPRTPTGSNTAGRKLTLSGGDFNGLANGGGLDLLTKFGTITIDSANGTTVGGTITMNAGGSSSGGTFNINNTFAGAIGINAGATGQLNLNQTSTGAVNIDNVNIDGGLIDATSIGSSSATDATFTALKFTTTTTGGNAGTAICLDVNDRFCKCGLCA